MSTRDEYDRFASQYHAKRLNPAENLWNEHLDYPMISNLLGSALNGKSVIDLGCGSGIFTGRLRSKVAAIQGVDASRNLIEIARRENPGLSFDVGDVTDTRLETSSFDLALSSLVMHYLKDLDGFFREAGRVLKPDGRFVFSFHHPFNEVMSVREDFVQLNPYFHAEAYRWQMLEGMELESYHHTFESIFEALAKSGFGVERLLEAKAPVALKEKYPDLHAFASRFPTFAAISAINRKT